MNEPPKRKRRWFQFSLRLALIFTLIVAIPCAWLGRKIEQKRWARAAVKAIRDLGGQVSYEYQQVGGSSFPPPRPEPPGPAWLRNLLGQDFFSDVGQVILLGTNAGDDDLEKLKGFTQLRSLNLGATKVTDAGLTNLNGFTQLRFLNLDMTKVGDAGLANLKGLARLQYLYLNKTNVGDAGLASINGLTQLRTLALTRTRATDAGVGGLQRALPNCRINH
jgi:hypothetical protein